MLSVSIVSHGQADLIGPLLQDLARCLSPSDEVLLTLNIPERLILAASEFPYELRVLKNDVPKGFAANHNAAFANARGESFCVMNPDIRIEKDPFPDLYRCLADDCRIAACAPLIVGPDGELEDSARRFPTPWIILSKLIGRRRSPDYELREPVVYPDWLAGMFILFRRQAFQAMSGFDERYFLYYEDVDLSARLALAGWRVALCTKVCAVHAARRQSHRSVRYLRWHIGSMLRFFSSGVYRRVWRAAQRPAA